MTVYYSIPKGEKKNDKNPLGVRRNLSWRKISVYIRILFIINYKKKNFNTKLA